MNVQNLELQITLTIILKYCIYKIASNAVILLLFQSRVVIEIKVQNGP